MAWRYRIKEVRLTTGETRYYPQFRADWFPFWCFYREYFHENKKSFMYYSDALGFIKRDSANSEPEVKKVVKHHYL